MKLDARSVALGRWQSWRLDLDGVPLLRYEIRRHSVEYLAGQLYFDPHPKELMVRNHV
jgi:hypothetical protein